MRTQPVHNAYVRGVRFWRVKAACGGMCEWGVKVLGGVEVQDQVRDGVMVGWVKPTRLRRVGFTHPTVSTSSVAYSVQPAA